MKKKRIILRGTKKKGTKESFLEDSSQERKKSRKQRKLGKSLKHQATFFKLTRPNLFFLKKKELVACSYRALRRDGNCWLIRGIPWIYFLCSRKSQNFTQQLHYSLGTCKHFESL